MGLSITAYARHRGVSHVAVLKAIKTGRITKEPDGTINPAKADAAWERNTNQAQQRNDSHNSAPAISGPSYAQSRAIREAYSARLAKLEYEEKSGALVRADSVKVAWFNVLRVLRDRVLNLPDRMAPLLAAEPDVRKTHELLENELRQILEDAADAVQDLNKPSE